ncbi:Pentatricopeptide repeat [Dillenia turbinata]|uniref:Pentatricopeptide repeat n=1 Tax=Dillenia turbinata TaxID=194707 RepID=A0AAN8V0W4_9MAGN
MGVWGLLFCSLTVFGSEMLFHGRVSLMDLEQMAVFRRRLGFFEKMMVHEDGKCGLVKPNEATFVTLLSACAEGGKGLDYGKQIHGYILKGVCTWNAMILSLASNGKEKEAFELFEEMMLEKMQPNEITFVTVLGACARARHVDLGLELFMSTLDKFSVVPRMEYYGCVVDLLGRAGLLKEATEFISKMPLSLMPLLSPSSCKMLCAGLELAALVNLRLAEQYIPYPLLEQFCMWLMNLTTGGIIGYMRTMNSANVWLFRFPAVASKTLGSSEETSWEIRESPNFCISDCYFAGSHDCTGQVPPPKKGHGGLGSAEVIRSMCDIICFLCLQGDPFERGKYGLLLVHHM